MSDRGLSGRVRLRIRRGEMIIRVGFSNDTSNHPALHKALFKLPPDMDLVPFLVVEKILHQFTSRFSGRNESFFVVEQARSAEYLVAVEIMEKDVEMMACIVPQNHNFDAEVYWHSFPFQSGKTMFYGKWGAHEKKEKKIRERQPANLFERHR